MSDSKDKKYSMEELFGKQDIGYRPRVAKPKKRQDETPNKKQEAGGLGVYKGVLRNRILDECRKREEEGKER